MTSKRGVTVKLQALIKSPRSFHKSRDGNIAIMFAFLFVLLMLFTGGAVDFTRYNAVRADLIESMDASGLAIAQLDAMNGPEIKNLSPTAREAYLKDYGRRFFLENFTHEDLVDDLTIDFDISSATITPRAEGNIKTLFLHIASDLLGNQSGSFQQLSLSTDTEITRRGSGKIELALVLDVTGSMRSRPSGGGDKKIESLRDAVDNLLDVMYGTKSYDDNIKIGIVPFNAHVNPAGAATWSSTWTDESAVAPYHGARFFHVDENGDVDMTKKVNHLDLFNSVTGASWMGCVEARPYPLDELDTAPGVSVQESYITTANASLTSTEEPDARMRDAFLRAPQLSLSSSVIASSDASRWVPTFRADEPDCRSSGSNCEGNYTKTESYTLGGAPVSVSYYGYWFDNPDDDNNSTSSYSNRNFIDDKQYIYYGQGEATPRYASIVEKYRTAMNAPGNTDPFEVFLRAQGADDETKDEYILRNAYVGWWDPLTNTYKYKYDLSPSIDETISDTSSSMLGPNEDCPAAILPLTADRTKIEDKVADLFPNGNTNSANGAVWGWRVLSNAAPFTEGVPSTNMDWQKAVVIMTDGQNTIGNYDTHRKSGISAYGYAPEERMGEDVNRGDRKRSAFDSDDMRDHLDEKLLRICRRMKKDGILVYTILFDLNDTDTEEVFRSCATSPTEPYFFVAPDGDDLERAFGDIAQDLVNLHVSR